MRLYGIFTLVQSYLRTRGWSINLFDGEAFEDARKCLDAAMHERSTEGLGKASAKRTDVITEDEEDQLWSSGALGDSTPKHLLDTTLYLTGLNPHRCYVALFEKYRSLIPNGTVHFFCTPRPSPKEGVWFLDKAVGHNTLSTIIKKMCTSCGIPGKTNHSLRATAATRLYQTNADEQICEITGHRSEEVRCYKRASDEQRQVASSIVSPTSKKQKCETVTNESSENAGHVKTSDRPIVFNFNIT